LSACSIGPAAVRRRAFDPLTTLKAEGVRAIRLRAFSALSFSNA
jgi:hypothetical protein